MKFDAVAPYGCTFPHEVASKGNGHTDDHITVYMLKADVESVREGRHDITAPIESTFFEDVDPIQCGNSPGPPCYADIQDSIKTYQTRSKCMEASYSFPIGKIGLARKETDFYTEKTVTEIDLLDTIACFTEGAYHTVKDVCIDEGALSLEKVLLESKDKKLSSRLDHSVSSVNYSLTKGTPDNIEMNDDSEPILLGLKSSSINKHPASLTDKDDTEQCSSGNSLIGGGGKSGSAALCEAIREKHLLHLQGLDTESWRVDSSSFSLIKGQKQSTLHQNIDQITFEEGNSTTKDVPPAAEEAIQSNRTKGNPANSEVGAVNLHFDFGIATVNGSEESKENPNQQSGVGQYIPESEKATPRNGTEESSANGELGAIKLHFDSGITTVSGSEEGKENTNQQSGVGQYIPESKESTQSNRTEESHANGEVGAIKLHFNSGITTVSGCEESRENTNQQSEVGYYILESEEATLDGATASTRSSFVHNGHVDINLYGPASLSGPIVSSGYIAYSGSTSLRSDSSTTSARSFAFPILQSEWISSPVKMAKADRRRLRKHRGWRVGLLCCRF